MARACQSRVVVELFLGVERGPSARAGEGASCGEVFQPSTCFLGTFFGLAVPAIQIPGLSQGISSPRRCILGCLPLLTCK